VNVFILSASGGQKPQFWANFDILIWGGAPVPTPFTDEGHIWRAKEDPRLGLRAKFRPGFILSSSRKPTKFAVFWTSAFCDVANAVGGNLRKLNTDAQLQTCPYPTAFKIVSVLQHLHGDWRNRAHKL